MAPLFFSLVLNFVADRGLDGPSVRDALTVCQEAVALRQPWVVRWALQRLEACRGWYVWLGRRSSFDLWLRDLPARRGLGVDPEAVWLEVSGHLPAELLPVLFDHPEWAVEWEMHSQPAIGLVECFGELLFPNGQLVYVQVLVVQLDDPATGTNSDVPARSRSRSGSRSG